MQDSIWAYLGRYCEDVSPGEGIKNLACSRKIHGEQFRNVMKKKILLQKHSEYFKFSAAGSVNAESLKYIKRCQTEYWTIGELIVLELGRKMKLSPWIRSAIILWAGLIGTALCHLFIDDTLDILYNIKGQRMMRNISSCVWQLCNLVHYNITTFLDWKE